MITKGHGSTLAGALVLGSPSQPSCDVNHASAVAGRVVHCKRERFDVLIDRRTQFGNPYKMRPGADGADRAGVIADYEKWARLQAATNPDWAAAVKALYGKTLGCWCAPKACHGDVLLKIAAELMAATDRGNAR